MRNIERHQVRDGVDEFEPTKPAGGELGWMLLFVIIVGFEWLFGDGLLYQRC